MSPIRTYVFMDLETTGLPREESNTTKITELSMIAVKREHLLDTPKGKSPRVQNKLTLCFNPCKLIQSEGTNVTGLCNFLLENENRLDRHTFGLIDTFLSLLTQPVCLIAQNGDYFDYPILKNNLERLKVNFSSDIKCADCYFAFYDILHGNVRPDNVTPQLISNKNQAAGESLQRASKVRRQLAKDFHSELNLDEKGNEMGIMNLKVSNGANKCLKQSSPEINREVIDIYNNKTTMSDFKHSNTDMEKVNNKLKQNVACETTINFICPDDSKNENILNDTCNTVTVPHNLKEFINDDTKMFANDSKYMQKINESTPRHKIAPSVNSIKRRAKRRFPWMNDGKPRESYKLANIYKRQLNREPPEAHRAENDCVMAMEIAVTVAEQFVEWVDNNYDDYKDVVPMTIGVRL